VIASKAALQQAELADAEAGRKAIAAGKPLPKPKAETMRAELAEAERELELVVELVRPSADELLAAATEVAERVADETIADADSAELDALEHLQAAARALDVAARLRVTAGWARKLQSDGEVPTFSASSPTSLGSQAVATALRELTNDRERRAERAAEHEHELVALNVAPAVGGGFRQLPDPPDRATLEWLEREHGVGDGARSVRPSRPRLLPTDRDADRVHRGQDQRGGRPAMARRRLRRG
jgi:cell division septum initiation protein DivIVA